MRQHKNVANEIDVHVGQRLRLRRMLKGISQERLGEKLGLTFQQIQKYERGINRIGASRLYEIAQILDVPIGYFFEEMPEQVAALADAHHDGRASWAYRRPFDSDVLISRETTSLLRAFQRIREPEVRRRTLELLRVLADRPQAD
ncbi:helix-turn-helix transcriptional regulator [Arenibaculum sp.]|jgi:transcriptional regulator with XRE-family HTH domain|uniref:helix-turn-helix domain-containing protein n=1 Tax=Arenibaculum sp. TaxID=2865862 RepID=UPI002E141182|nr:helix-turn-helix transcriptional regulator [Arenibaculum sp.]